MCEAAARPVGVSTTAYMRIQSPFFREFLTTNSMLTIQISGTKVCTEITWFSSKYLLQPCHLHCVELSPGCGRKPNTVMANDTTACTVHLLLMLLLSGVWSLVIVGCGFFRSGSGSVYPPTTPPASPQKSRVHAWSSRAVLSEDAHHECDLVRALEAVCLVSPTPLHTQHPQGRPPQILVLSKILVRHSLVQTPLHTMAPMSDAPPLIGGMSSMGYLPGFCLLSFPVS